MKQKYIFHLKIYIFFQSCLVLKTDTLGLIPSVGNQKALMIKSDVKSLLEEKIPMDFTEVKVNWVIDGAALSVQGTHQRPCLRCSLKKKAWFWFCTLQFVSKRNSTFFLKVWRFTVHSVAVMLKIFQLTFLDRPTLV